MKRDMDLIRSILLHIESDNEYNEIKGIQLEAFPEQDARVLSAHFTLIKKRGLIDKLTLASGGYILAGEMSNQGYDFLDSIRDPEIWKQTKEVANAAGGWTLSLLGDLAKGLIKTKIEKHTGVEL